MSGVPLSKTLLTIPLGKTHPEALTKCMNMDIWVIGTLNKLLINSNKIKQKVVSGKTSYKSVLYSLFYLSNIRY